MTTCQIQGCVRPLLARGWCSLHYDRWKRTGDPGETDSKKQKAGSLCAVLDCVEVVKCWGMCGTHYTRLKKYGVLSEAPLTNVRGISRDRECSVEACSRTIINSRGWCGLHYQRWRATGDPTKTLYPRRQTSGPIGYNAAHHRVRESKGRASEHPCDSCAQPATQWAYSYADPEPLMDGLGCAYSLNVEFYVPMCRNCHVTLDKLHRRLRVEGAT